MTTAPFTMAVQQPMEYDREEQMQRFGVDCGDGIDFRGGEWVPGGEYIKKLVVRNVSQKTQKFKYKLPKTKFFSMAFPEAITLSPGMNAQIDVVFRPIKLEEYDDDILIMIHSVKAGQSGAAGQFFVPVRARLAHLSLTADAGIDFGFCPTAELAERAFTLTNSGQLPATFAWDVAPPFTLAPTHGHLEPGEKVDVVTGVVPANASVLVSNAVCRFESAASAGPASDADLDDREGSLTTKLSAIGKYAHIELNQSYFDFGDVMIGSEGSEKVPVESEFVLSNPSLVPASFKIVPADHDNELRDGLGEVFAFSQTQGCIEAESDVHIKVRFTPRTGGMFTCDTYDVVTPGGNRRSIVLKGSAQGPRVSVTKADADKAKSAHNSINFGDVAVGSAVRRALIVRNDSELPAHFSFAAEKGGTFAFDEVCGVVAGKLSKVVNLTFAPADTGNFYRRVTVLVQHQMPCFVDLLGTAYTSKLRPEPLLQVHVDAYRHRAREGLQMLSMTEMDQMLEDGDEAYFVRPNKTSIGTALERRVADDAQLTRSGETTRTNMLIAQEYFVPATSSSLPVQLDREIIDFGASSAMRGNTRRQLVRLTNNTHGKLHCLWRIPSGAGLDGDDGKDHFDVSPPVADMLPGETVEFRVGFSPTHANSYYCQELEACVSFKAARNFRLVNGRTLGPPWCAPLRVMGHTFEAGHEQFLPQVSIIGSGSTIAFPACHVGDSVFQTVALHNAGSTPALFNFTEDPSGIFTVKPSAGLLQKHTTTLVCLRFSPQRSHRYVQRLECVLNNDVAHSMHVDVIGLGCLPQLAFDMGKGLPSGGHEAAAPLYFKPTACGLVTRRAITVHNTARIPVVFKCELPARLRGCLSLAPRVGRLRGNESVDVQCAFAPRIERQYCENVRFTAKAIAMADGSMAARAPVACETAIKLVGLGTSSAISMSPQMVDFATTLVKKQATQTVTLVNSGDSAVLYRLRALPLGQIPRASPGMGFSAEELEIMRKRRLCSRGPMDPNGATALDMSFSKPAGILDPRSRTRVTLSFLPAKAGSFAFAIYCETLAADACGEATTTTPVDECFELAASADETEGLLPEPLVCKAIAKAAFPTLMVADVRCAQVSTACAWQKLGIGRLNSDLARPLTSSEVLFNADTSPDYTQLRPYEMLFEPGAVGAAPQSISFLLQNPGQLGVDFDVRFPNESEVELERWADKGEPTEEEVRTNWVIDHGLFEVSPRKGSIAGGDKLVFTLTYHYNEVGEHRLPVVLRIAKGKQLRLMLHSKTLEPAQPQVVLPAGTLQLAPMAIGQAPADAPTQTILLQNHGGAELQYSVDMEPLRRLVAENYDFDVLTCANPEGRIGPHSAIDLSWRFCPLQAKEYVLPLHVSFRGGYSAGEYEGKAEATLTARGFHPHRKEAAGADAEADAASSGLLMPVQLEPPRQQQLTPAAQLLGLSLDRVRVGVLPQGGVSYQLVVVRNLSDTATVMFEWDASHPLVESGLVRLHPQRGELAPAAQTACKLTITAVGQPRVIDDDLCCRVEEVAPPEEPLRALSTRDRMSASSTVLNPAKEVRNIGRKQHQSVVERTTKSRALKVLPTLPYRADPTAPAPSTAGAPSKLGGSRAGLMPSTAQSSGLPPVPGTGGALRSEMSSLGGGGGGGRRPQMSVNVSEAPLPAPEAARLRVQATVVELDAYRAGTDGGGAECGPRRGLKEFWIPKRGGGAAGGRCGGAGSGAAALAALDASDRDLLQDVLGFLVCDVVGSTDVVEALDGLPKQADTLFFRNFDAYKRRVDAPAPGAPVQAGGGADPDAGGAEAEAEAEASSERARVQVLKNPEAQDLIGRVLENTVYNLLQEAVHGESNMTVVPKRYVVADNTEEEAEGYDN
eukprot:g336.t1